MGYITSNIIQQLYRAVFSYQVGEAEIYFYVYSPPFVQIQSFLAKSQTFIPQYIVRITESTGLLYQFALEFLHLFSIGIHFCAD